ncbi:hypothetical protein [Arcticibacterium luteifluviistationis]|uniref:Outer membrane protein beta-barrel domain-containing protein n=1 Tax=Arcticibacterium luteifluviistationis TaxID=1784714 RepID=A0A2Z4GDP8_9BACT|nr:hypothetical protein [Arcticibacterium luteifluviistationis]AWV99366.1 hypothetical protein DJ013_14830 [Arcticibacterium luteifluviistationis]
MNHSFKNQWRKAFENAEENPPIDVWRKIEGELDEELMAEASLKNVLLTASEMPDNSVWENIEKSLDKEEERKPFIAFWLNKYTAAGIAALLLLALSFSLFNNSFTSEEENNQLSNSKSLDSDRNIGDSENHISPNFETSIAEGKSRKVESLEKAQKIQTTRKLAANITRSDRTKASLIKPVTENSSFIETKKPQNTEVASSTISSSIETLSSLVKKGFDSYGTRFTMNRKKLSYQTPDNLLADNSSFFRRSWFGLFSGVSPFDPNFKINNFERAALVSASDIPFQPNSVGETTNPIKSETFAIPLSQPYNNVKAGRSVNISLNYGKRFKKHWSIESGARYLAGNSLVASNVYSYNQFTGRIQSFLESNYIRQDAGVFDNTVISSGADVDSDYQFLMIPLQVGYHLPVSKKLEAAVVAGVSGDFIINNVFDNISEGGSKLTSGNSAYKAVNLSGLAGLKLNYAIRSNWQVSVGSNFQQTITSGVERTEGFSFKPRYLGINYGVNYRFH